MKHRIYVTFDMDIEQDATYQEIQNWLAYVLGMRGELSLNNPLIDVELKANAINYRHGVDIK